MRWELVYVRGNDWQIARRISSDEFDNSSIIYVLQPGTSIFRSPINQHRQQQGCQSSSLGNSSAGWDRRREYTIYSNPLLTVTQKGFNPSISDATVMDRAWWSTRSNPLEKSVNNTYPSGQDLRGWHARNGPARVLLIYQPKLIAYHQWDRPLYRTRICT